jgi:hypothetical protein
MKITSQFQSRSCSLAKAHGFEMPTQAHINTRYIKYDPYPFRAGGGREARGSRGGRVGRKRKR